jgi:hypothetical protein
MSDGPTQRPLPDKIQHSQQTDKHAPSGIRIHTLSKPAAADRAGDGIGYLDKYRDMGLSQ